jgi:pimeloyl-ACP methyl ester carboxylesterase
MKSHTSVNVAILSVFCASGLRAQVETFDLPRLDEIRIDGDFSDWDDGQGFAVEVLLQEEGTFKNAEDHNVHFRAGWNKQGILIHLTVEDNNWVEYPEKGKYYSADVVEVFLAGKRGDDDVCQWYITPGMTDEVREPGVRFRELRRGPTKGMPSELKVFREKLSANRYRMEIIAPWSSIGKDGVVGSKSAFQIWVNDKDQGSRRRRYMSIFYPAKGASYASRAMHNIQLVDDTRPSLRISSLGEYDTKLFQPFVRLWATAERTGKKVRVKQDGTELGASILNSSDSPGRSTAKVLLPPASAGQPYSSLGVFLEGQKVNSLSLPYSDVIGTLKGVYEKRAQYREMFKLDEPWADIANAPLLERHRGLAAAGLNLLEETPLPSGAREMEILSTTIAMLRAVDNGEDYFGQQRNGLWGYYYCKADATGQRFSMSIPGNYDPQRSYPLYVNLHGNGGRPLPTKSEVQQTDYFQIRPWGRGDISFFGLGEVDVLESIRHVLKWYPIDPDRICLGGHSMGGNATWDLASKHTNLFACLAPKAGRSGDDYYENFRHLPSLIQHGAKDSSQPVDFGRYTVSRLEQLGFPVIYKEFPEDGHGIRAPYPVEEWLVKQRRPRSPEIISYSCDTTRNGEAYWVRIRRFVDPHRKATIDARVTKRERHQIVDLKLKNIEVIELDLDNLPADKSKALILTVGANEIEVAAPQSRRATLVLKNGDWRRVDSWTPPTTAKRPYMPGGAGNLYSGEPLLIVFPTEGNEENRKPLEMAAQGIVRYGGYGGDMITGHVPIKADQNVTESDLQHRNLILFGGPKYNTVSRRLAAELPVKVNAKNQFVVAGHPPMDADKSSMLLTTFNPMAPQRLIHVIWQDEIPEETRDRFPRFARNLLPGASGRYPHNAPDLQISSRELLMSIRRQFTYGWKLKERNGADKQQSQQVLKEGLDIAKLRIMRTKAKVDVAISRGIGAWRTGSREPPSLDQFRYRNFRLTTFKAKIKGRHLEKLFADPASQNLISYPPFGSGELDPEKDYSIVAPEGILWAVKPIKNYWTDMVAGPDIHKSEIIREVYGVEE